MNIAAFNQQRLAAQYETFGEPAVIGGLSCLVCAGSHDNRAQLEEGGMAIDFDRIARARMEDFTTAPKAGVRAEIGGQKYRIERVTTSPHAGEYIFGLTQQR